MNILSVYYLYSYSYYYENLFNSTNFVPTPTSIPNATNSYSGLLNDTYEPSKMPTTYSNATPIPTPVPTTIPASAPTTVPTPVPTSAPSVISTTQPLISTRNTNQISGSDRVFPSLGYSLVCFPLTARFTFTNLFYHVVCVFATVVGGRIFVS